MSSPVRRWVDLSPEADAGVTVAARQLHLHKNEVIAQAVEEFLQRRGLLCPTEKVVTRSSATRGLKEMALVRGGAEVG